MEVECPVGNVVGSVEQVFIFSQHFFPAKMTLFSQSLSLFTPTYTVHDGAGNEKFIVEVQIYKLTKSLYAKKVKRSVTQSETKSLLERLEVLETNKSYS